MIREQAQELNILQNPVDLDLGEIFHLRYGPLDLYLERAESQLRLRWMTSQDFMDSSFEYQLPFKGMFPENLLSEKRFAFTGKIPPLKILPCLGEKPFVARPETPFMILPGEKTSIYLSTPMSLRIMDNQSHQIIDELPVIERTKTWFGDSFTSGQLCFFTHIHAALKEDELPFRPHRALTLVTIENRSKKTIQIKRLKIPAPYLTLYQEERGVFVTSTLNVKCDIKGKVKELKIVRPSLGDGKNVQIFPPREALPSSIFKSVTELMR
ncbi:MAG: DUF432 domain-containing protein [Bdellovibrionales bacterium]|nr:DUF432 domain-containing protein [Bdellovibrionales bacterium]